MEYLPRDVLKIMLARLDDKEVNSLYRNKSLIPVLDSIFEDNSFWKIRVENLLKIEETDLAFNNWKRIYYALLKTKDLKVYAEKGDSEVVELLLVDPRVDPSVDNNYAIWMASQKGHDKVVELLLANSRVDPSDGDNFAIRLASQYGRYKVVELLLADPRVDPSAEDNYAIRFASANGHDKIVELLLADPRVDPSADNNYAIRWASRKGHDKVVKLLKNYFAKLRT